MSLVLSRIVSSHWAWLFFTSSSFACTLFKFSSNTCCRMYKKLKYYQGYWRRVKQEKRQEGWNKIHSFFWLCPARKKTCKHRFSIDDKALVESQKFLLSLTLVTRRKTFSLFLCKTIVKYEPCVIFCLANQWGLYSSVGREAQHQKSGQTQVCILTRYQVFIVVVLLCFVLVFFKR